MCGISGFLHGGTDLSIEEKHNIVARMASVITHRGPDDGGVWVAESGGVALSHRRLSILDLSPEGHQPMISAERRYVITYNGEVYNFPDLRKQLKGLGRTFRGEGDTEVVLAAVETWGLEAAIKLFIGMFAFALWDMKEQKLHLVCDRLGKKPLYYGWVNRTFVFGSELSSLRAFPGFNNEINRDAIALLMRHSCIPAPYSIYKDVHKVMPGQCLTVDPRNLREPSIHSYWSARDVVEKAVASPFKGSEEDAVDELDYLIRDAVGLRMIADVPLGAFLSGGYDSSMVVAQMQAQCTKPVKTFSIGFNEEIYNEAHHARAIAQHLKTDHTELYVSADEAMMVVPKLATLYDEPFSDSSQIPTYLVSKLAREHVTVCLSGDGGDEVFGGYNRYFWADQVWGKAYRFPKGLRSGVSTGIYSISQQRWNQLFSIIERFIPSRYRFSLPGDKLHKFAEVLKAGSSDEVYKILVSHWKEPTNLVLGSSEPLTVLTDIDRQASLTSFSQRMMFSDLVSYLPDDILTKVDRASMGLSLEVRVPLIDHRLVEFAWRLPMSMKIRNGQGKWILREVLDRYVPRALMERPKMGFGIPLGEWLRGPLKEWAESLLGSSRLKHEGIFNAYMVQNKWREHLSGARDWHGCLWDVLMFQAWLEQNK